MVAYYDYESSIYLSEGNASSRDPSPSLGDHATDTLQEGVLSPTLSLTPLHPDGELESSKGKGPSDYDQSQPTTGSERDEAPASNHASRSEDDQLPSRSLGTYDSRAQTPSANRHYAVTIARSVIEYSTVTVQPHTQRICLRPETVVTRDSPS